MQRITLWGFSVPESHLSASTQSVVMPGEVRCISVALSRYRRDTAMCNWQGSIATFYVAGCVFGCAAVSDIAAGVEGFQGLGLLVVRLGEWFLDTQLSIAWLCCGLVSLGCWIEDGMVSKRSISIVMSTCLISLSFYHTTSHPIHQSYTVNFTFY